jgi:hypothetical protein
VLLPAIQDYDGDLWVTGTPGPVPAGYFFNVSTGGGWSHHGWTAFDNPWILRKSGRTSRQHLDAELARRGISEDDPGIQREWFGRWAYDPRALVFAWTRANSFDVLPEAAQWEYAIGVDLGFDDADAIAVLAWTPTRPAVWLVEEWVGSKQSITQLAERLAALGTKYSPRAVVADTGALGKKIVDEINRRYRMGITAAEKVRKLEHIELLNDALRSGRFYARANGPFAQDAMRVEWDRERPEAPKISDRFHSDITDAVLYAYRSCLHWRHSPAESLKLVLRRRS